MKTQFKLNDKVKFNRSFLQRLGDSQYEYSKKIGIVIQIKQMENKTQYLKILWDDNEEKGCLNTNLCKIGQEGIPLDFT